MSTDNVVPFPQRRSAEHDALALLALRIQAIAWTARAIATAPAHQLALSRIADLAAAIAIDLEAGTPGGAA